MKAVRGFPTGRRRGYFFGDADIIRAAPPGVKRDGSVPPASVRELEAKLKGLGREVEMHIYPGTDHAFFNDTRPEVYDAGAAADAWRRAVRFLRRNLSSGDE